VVALDALRTTTAVGFRLAVA